MAVDIGRDYGVHMSRFVPIFGRNLAILKENRLKVGTFEWEFCEIVQKLYLMMRFALKLLSYHNLSRFETLWLIFGEFWRYT